MSRALLEKAVKAAQLYQSSTRAPMRAQQKLYDRMRKAIHQVAEKYGASEMSVFDQVMERARILPPIYPTPGKDY